MLTTVSPYPQFFDLDGSPLDQGFVYFGQLNQNPETAPKQAFWDYAGTQTAPQPIRTMNGYMMRSGSPAQVYVDGDYSITVKNRRGKLVAYAPSSLAGTVETNVTGLIAVSIANLRADYANQSDITKGLALLGYKHSATATGRTGADRLRQSVSLQDYGGADDWDGTTGTDNAPALAKIKTLFPNGVTILLPLVSRGNYRFTAAAAGVFNGYTFDADEGVTLTLPDEAANNSPMSRWVRDTKMHFIFKNIDYVMKASVSSSDNYAKNKSFFPGAGDRDTTIIDAWPLNTSPVETIGLPWPNGPFGASTGVTLVDAETVSFDLVGGNNAFQYAEIPAVPGSEYSCYFDIDGNFDGFLSFGVITQNGFDIYYEGAVGPTSGGTHAIHEFGSAFVEGPAQYLGSDTHQSMWAKNGVCTVRCVTFDTFVVLVNGVERFSVRKTASAIRGILFGAGFGTVNSSIRVKNITRMRKKEARGQKPMKILAIGDSITDPAVHGNWPSFMAEALEGYMGLRVRELRNIAVAGDAATQQLAKLNATNIGDIDLAVILIGTNDIQGLVAPVDYIANVRAMLDKLNAANIPCVVGVPTMFYTRALATAATGDAGQGQDSVNYERGAPYRAKLMWEIATRNQRFNKICWLTMEELGPAFAPFLATSAHVDPIVNDNIHPTSHARRLLGYAFARSVAGALAPASDRAYPATPLQPAWFANSWTAAGAGYEIDSAGALKFYGVLNKNAGPITDGTTILLLPMNLRPSQVCRFRAASWGAGVTPNGDALVVVTGAGAVQLYNAPVGTEGLYLDALQYKVAP